MPNVSGTSDDKVLTPWVLPVKMATVGRVNKAFANRVIQALEEQEYDDEARAGAEDGPEVRTAS